MKHYTLHIISLLLVASLVVCCTKDLEMPDGGEITDGQNHTYTLHLSIDEGPTTRSLTSDPVGAGFKTSWCYGDTVVLTSSMSSSKYKFIIAVPTGKVKGDPVETRVATFTYDGPAIPSFTHFTGTLSYDCGISRTTRVTCGCTATSATTSYKPGSAADYILEAYPYAIQRENDNAEHLKCLDNLSVTLTSKDLSQHQVFTLQRSFSIIKIVLDDIYYPLYGGATLFLKGLKKVGISDDGLTGIILGQGIVQTDADATHYAASELYDAVAQNPAIDKGAVPFFDVSAEKRPFTDYAVRDESHKLVAYIPILEEREITEGDVLTIGLRDSWALEWYFWKTDPLKPFKLPLGSIYTIDLTRKYSGKYQYEATVALNLSARSSGGLGLFGTKNVGAKNLTDPGAYYLFGYSQPIYPGGHFPPGLEFPGDPVNTPYYYYAANSAKKDCIAYCFNNGADVKYPLPVTLTGSSINITESSPLELYEDDSRTLPEWWAYWIPELAQMPTIVNSWNLPVNYKTASFRDNDMKYVYTLLGADGSPTTTDPVGVRIASPRTGHSVFMPVSGILAASAEDPVKRQILEGAVAEVMPGTENYAVALGQYIMFVKTTDSKELQLSIYSFQLDGTCSTAKLGLELKYALPVRPTYMEVNVLPLVLPKIPGLRI